MLSQTARQPIIRAAAPLLITPCKLDNQTRLCIFCQRHTVVLLDISSHGSDTAHVGLTHALTPSDMGTLLPGTLWRMKAGS